MNKNEEIRLEISNKLTEVLERAGIELEPYDKGLLDGIAYARQMKDDASFQGAAGFIEIITLIAMMKRAAESIQEGAY
jgi:hypothetical protein